MKSTFYSRALALLLFLFLLFIMTLVSACSSIRHPSVVSSSAIPTIQHTSTINQHSVSIDTASVSRSIASIIRDFQRSVSLVVDSTTTVVDTSGRVVRTDHNRTVHTATSSDRESVLRDSIRDLRLQYQALLEQKVKQSEVPVLVERKQEKWEQFFIRIGIMSSILVVVAVIVTVVWLIYRRRDRHSYI